MALVVETSKPVNCSNVQNYKVGGYNTVYALVEYGTVRFGVGFSI